MSLKIIEKGISLTEDIPIIVVTYIVVISYVKGYQVEQVHGEIKPNSPVDKNVLAVGKIAGYLPLRKNGTFAKTIFYFLLANL